MIFREARLADIPQIQSVRHSVQENRLSNPMLVSDEDVALFLTIRGKGWVCVVDNLVVGFAIADLLENNIWALFVMPEYEKQGIGNTLQARLLHWYFLQTKEKLWLGTAPGTRAEAFYRMSGWTETGKHGKGEIKFEMSYQDWRRR